MKKVLLVCLMAMVLTGCLTTKDPRGIQGRILRDVGMDQNYMAMRKANGLYQLCQQMPDGSYIIP